MIMLYRLTEVLNVAAETCSSMWTACLQSQGSLSSFSTKGLGLPTQRLNTYYTREGRSAWRFHQYLTCSKPELAGGLVPHTDPQILAVSKSWKMDSGSAFHLTWRPLLWTSATVSGSVLLMPCNVPMDVHISWLGLQKIPQDRIPTSM